jgi:uncharacterized protein YbjT (DUF2867 family)
MKIAIVGATGTAGALTTAVAKNRGHEVVEISRAGGIDLHTGAGLTRALAGAEAVIDTSNPVPTRPSENVVDAMSSATRHLVEACTAAGVEHLVFLSISNIDKPELDEFPYYRAKREQERVIRDSALPATIVRSTQWYEFATNPSVVAETENAVEVQDWLIQPIAARAVAEVLVDEASARHESRSISGPQVIALPELTARVLAVRGDHRPVVAVPAVIESLSRGLLLAPSTAELIGPDLETWLRQN